MSEIDIPLYAAVAIDHDELLGVLQREAGLEVAPNLDPASPSTATYSLDEPGNSFHITIDQVLLPRDLQTLPPWIPLLVAEHLGYPLRCCYWIHCHMAETDNVMARLLIAQIIGIFTRDWPVLLTDNYHTGAYTSEEYQTMEEDYPLPLHVTYTADDDMQMLAAGLTQEQQQLLHTWVADYAGLLDSQQIYQYTIAGIQRLVHLAGRPEQVVIRQIFAHVIQQPHAIHEMALSVITNIQRYEVIHDIYGEYLWIETPQALFIDYLKRSSPIDNSLQAVMRHYHALRQQVVKRLILCDITDPAAKGWTDIQQQFSNLQHDFITNVRDEAYFALHLGNH